MQAALLRQAAAALAGEAARTSGNVGAADADSAGQTVRPRSQIDPGMDALRMEVRAGEIPGEALLTKTGMFPATPFQNPAWLRAWQHNIGSSCGVTPVTAIGLVGNIPAFILPLAVVAKYGTRKLTWLAHPLNDYCAPIVSNAFLETAGAIDGSDALKRVAQTLGNIDLIYLPKTPALVAGLANPFVLADARPYHARAHAIRLPKDTSFDAFLAARRSSKTRRRIREKLNALEKFGSVEFRFARTPEEARTVTELCLDAKSRQLRENGFWDPFADRAAKEFLVSSFAGNIGETTWACSLSQGSEVLATSVGFKSPRNWLLYQMSMEDTGKERFSPGTHLLMNILRQCCEVKAEELDLALGDESYKAEWCDTDKDLLVSSLAVSAKGRVMQKFLSLKDRILDRIAADSSLYVAAKRLQRIARVMKIAI